MFGRSAAFVAALIASSGALAEVRTPIIYEAEDRDAVCRVMYAEARNQSDLGKIAVVEVIINRLRSGRFGGSISAVLEEKWAFEPVMRVGGKWRNLPMPSPSEYERCHRIIALKNGDDVSGGATFFQNAAIVKARAEAGTVKAKNVHFSGMPVTAEIEDHTFYSPSGAMARPVVRKEHVRPENSEDDFFGKFDGQLSGEAG